VEGQMMSLSPFFLSLTQVSESQPVHEQRRVLTLDQITDPNRATQLCASHATFSCPLSTPTGP
jgi:hypothetical protein